MRRKRVERGRMWAMRQRDSSKQRLTNHETVTDQAGRSGEMSVKGQGEGREGERKETAGCEMTERNRASIGSVNAIKAAGQRVSQLDTR